MKQTLKVGNFVTFKGKKTKEEILEVNKSEDRVTVRKSCCCGKSSKSPTNYSFQTLNQMINVQLVEIKV